MTSATHDTLSKYANDAELKVMELHGSRITIYSGRSTGCDFLIPPYCPSAFEPIVGIRLSYLWPFGQIWELIRSPHRR